MPALLESFRERTYAGGRRQRLSPALRLICTVRQTRVYAETHGPRVRRSLEELADRHTRHAMALVTGVLR